MQDEFIRWPAVKQASGISRTTAWRMERDGQFPRRRQISAHTVGWLRSEVEAWIASRSKVQATTLEAAA